MSIGKIIKPFGLKGEVKFCLFNESSSSLKANNNIWLKFSNGEISEYIVEKLFINDNRNIIKFKNIDNRDSAESIRGCEIYLSRKNFPSIEEDEFYFADILGFSVYNESDEILGVVDDILSLSGNNIMVINKDNKEFMIPLEDEFIKLFDFEGKKIIVNIIEGLLD